MAICGLTERLLPQTASGLKAPLREGGGGGGDKHKLPTPTNNPWTVVGRRLQGFYGGISCQVHFAAINFAV